MRSFAIAFGLACTAGFATPAFAQQLSYEPVFSIGQVSDADEDRTAEYEAARSLIERWGLVGVTYTDDTMRPDMAITRGEAAVLLAGAYDQGASLADSKLYYGEGKNTDATYGRITALLSVMAAAPTCGVKGGALPSDKAPDPAMEAAAIRLIDIYGAGGLGGGAKELGYSEVLDWGTAVRCMPMAPVKRQPLTDSRGEPVEAEQPIARGDFFVLLDRGMNFYAETLDGIE